MYSHNYRAVKAYAQYRHHQIHNNQPRQNDSKRRDPSLVNRARRRPSPARPRRSQDVEAGS